MLEWQKLDDIKRVRSRNTQCGFARSLVEKPNDSVEYVLCVKNISVQ